ncbi:hypothetical protein TanjilG_30862 [Lupinus angustifolius]|uniref:Uncharacterized protein n=1 Tax=Lupinus angustifolius TaxID=3871 RepID=A0A1J7H9I5_LUPAN|nr:hypothetical protein TanjilG_30862 [Lupinus angustifolius]
MMCLLLIVSSSSPFPSQQWESKSPTSFSSSPMSTLMEECDDANPLGFRWPRCGLKAITPNSSWEVHNGSTSLRWVTVILNQSHQWLSRNRLRRIEDIRHIDYAEASSFGGYSQQIEGEVITLLVSHESSPVV